MARTRTLLALGAMACLTCSGGAAPRIADPAAPGMEMVEFARSDEQLLNPERGMFAAVQLVDARDDFQHVRARGMTVALDRVQLDPWRTSLLPNELLDGMRAGFGRVRRAGLKVILRFAYNSGDGPDAPLDWMISHIAQLAPVLAANADVIAVVHAGFIGQWGEWHGSTHGLDNPNARRAIVEALLRVLPADRMLQVRTPMFKQEIFGARLAEADAFNGSWIARVGHHNDCFLASEDDWGTYGQPVWDWKSWVADEGRFTPVGGDTCRVNPPRTDCPSAVGELEALHWSLLNAVHHREVLARLHKQGCMDWIRSRLGYRFALERAWFAGTVEPGGELPVGVRLRNHGWAAPFNPRPVELVLQCGDRAHVTPLRTDPRRWESGRAVTVETRIRVPDDLPAGECSLALSFPDPAPTLAHRPDYAIQLANPGVWDAAHGYNVLTRAVQISPRTPARP